MPHEIEVRRVDEWDDGWERVTDNDRDDYGVALSQRGNEWGISVPGGEFIRDEPWGSEFENGVTQAVLGVPGITEARREDREVWIATGEASGEALCRAVSAAVDSVVDRLMAQQ